MSDVLLLEFIIVALFALLIIQQLHIGALNKALKELIKKEKENGKS